MEKGTQSLNMNKNIFNSFFSEGDLYDGQFSFFPYLSFSCSASVIWLGGWGIHIVLSRNAEEEGRIFVVARHKPRIARAAGNQAFSTVLGRSANCKADKKRNFVHVPLHADMQARAN